MTSDLPYVDRYVARKGIRDWMVWDRLERGPAKPGGRLEIGLTEERARQIEDELNKFELTAK